MRQLRQIDARIPVVLVTVVRSADSAIEAMRQGAYDYLLKPLDLQKLDRVIGEALKVARLMREPAVVVRTPPDDDQPGEAIVGSCPAMQEVYKAIGRVADQTFPVLITGRERHGQGAGGPRHLPARPAGQGAVPGPQLRRHPGDAAGERAVRPREGRLHRGGAPPHRQVRAVPTAAPCFLDEIGDMPLPAQAKVLRVLQEQAFERVGGSETIRTDVRLIAATHRDLKAWSDEGKFRLDLYYRLGVFTIHLPPLRERGEDLPLLVQFYLRRVSRELGREVREVAPEALARLRGYPWPGNVRELQSVLKQALLRAHGPVLLPEFLPELPEAPRRRAGGFPGGRLRPGGVPPPAARPRLSGPVRGDPPGAGPARAAPRPGTHRRQPGPGRPPARHRPAVPCARSWASWAFRSRALVGAGEAEPL